MGNNHFEKAVIYFFSGTGNAKFASEEIKQNLEQLGLNCYVFNIAKKDLRVKKPEDATLLGFCYPTHGFNAPPIMLRFLFEFPRGKSRIFLLNTRAGMKIYKFHTPGLGGMALWLPALIMWLKGYRIFGFRPLDMPSNWISLHPGLREKVVLSIKSNCSKTLKGFSEKISQGKTVLNGLIWMPIDVLVFPLAFGYYFYGRFCLAKTFYANHKCNNCNICIEKCPVHALKSIGGRPYWTYNCESCMQCMNICPHKAIETSHTYTFILWWTAWVVLPVFLPKLMIGAGIITQEFYERHFNIIHYIILYVAGLSFVFLMYRIAHVFLRNRFLNRVMTLFSLTHFKFWRRYYLPKVLRKNEIKDH